MYNTTELSVLRRTIFLITESLIIHKIQYIVINYINLFVFDDEIEMKNSSTIQTLTFVQTNPDHLDMKLVVVHAIIHSFGSKKVAPCKNFNWLLNWLLTIKSGTWKWHLAIFLAPTFWEPEQPLIRLIFHYRKDGFIRGGLLY